LEERQNTKPAGTHFMSILMVKLFPTPKLRYISGLILVYDLTNKNSLLNLRKWIAEYLSKSNSQESNNFKWKADSAFDNHTDNSERSTNNITEDMLELELSSGIILPILIIGNKEDLLEERTRQQHSSIEESARSILHVVNNPLLFF
jgi:GTPase SAR1 family protein